MCFDNELLMTPMRIRLPALLSRACSVLGLLAAVLAFMPAYAAESVGEYLLGPGDVIRVSVFQNPDLSLETRVSENGSISYPLIGSVAVGGQTLGAAEKKIATALKEGGFVVQPQVSIMLMQIRGNQVSVLGQVNRPGRYPLETAGLRLSDVLAMAGGIAQTGADSVIVTGKRDGKRFRREIDIAAMFSKDGSSEDFEVLGGDALYVARAPVFYIYGEVQRPGVFRLERDQTVMQALAQGGGLTGKGTLRGLQVRRRGSDGALQTVEPKQDDLLKPDDVVYVKESIF